MWFGAICLILPRLGGLGTRLLQMSPIVSKLHSKVCSVAPRIAQIAR
jgi:hypothetical protein